MIVLTTSDTLIAKMASLATSTNPTYYVSYVDSSDDAPGNSQGSLNGTSEVTIVSAPSSGTRVIDLGTIFNLDTVTNTITVQVANGANRRTVEYQAVSSYDKVQFGRQSTRITTQVQTALPVAIKDYIYFPVDIGIDSLKAAPSAAVLTGGNVGSNLITNGTFTSDTTSWTASGATLTSTAGGQSGNGLTVAASGAAAGSCYQDITTGVGKLYCLLVYFKKGTADTGKFTIGTTSSPASLYDSGNLSDAAWTLKTAYFTATETTTRITLQTNDATLNETSLFDTITAYEQSRRVVSRDFSGTTKQGLFFSWLPPGDLSAGTLKFRPIMIVSNATAPANTETIIFSLAGTSMGSSEGFSKALGTAVSSTFTADATYAQYDCIVGPWSADITVTDMTAGKSIMFYMERDPDTDTYAQVVGLIGIEIQMTRTWAS